MSTAKYFAFNNDLKVNIDDRFNERIHGVNSWNDLPIGFEIKQFDDINYKVGYGESQIDVQNRMYEGLFELLKANKGKTIAIISHSTAIAFLLKNGAIYLMIWNISLKMYLSLTESGNI